MNDIFDHIILSVNLYLLCSYDFIEILIILVNVYLVVLNELLGQNYLNLLNVVLFDIVN